MPAETHHFKNPDMHHAREKKESKANAAKGLSESLLASEPHFKFA